MTSRARLASFLLLSAAAHAGIFWSPAIMWRWPAQEHRARALRVEFADTEAPPARTQTAPVSPSPGRTQLAARTVMVVPGTGPTETSAPPAAERPVTSTSAATPSPPPTLDTRQPEAERSADVGQTAARVRVAIQTKLARYFVYPDLARERGWQGRVLLAFRVQSDGRLDQMHVARSCGYSLLDRAALDALRQVARVDTAALSGRALDVHLPVIYRLED